jgi:hypothetical protein
MSSSCVDEVGTDEVTQEIRKQRIVIRFDYPRGHDGPQIGAIILHFLGFRVVIVVGINPDEARVGNVAVEITHKGFYTHAQVWLKLKEWNKGMGVNLKATKAISLHLIPCIEFHLHFLKDNIVYLEYETFGFPSFLFRITILPNYTSMVWKTYLNGYHLLRVEHCGSISCIISWRIWRNLEGGWQFQQKSIDDQSFSTFPSNVVPLRPVLEGD